MMHAFLAFDLSKQAKENLGGLIRSLQTQTKSVRWIEPEKLHCTLKFFREIDEMVLKESVSQTIQQTAQKLSPVFLECVGVGVFPNWKYPSILWAGFTGEVETVVGWHTQLEEAFASYKIPKDPRQFRMHVTFGRMKSPVKKAAWLKTLEKMVTYSFGKVPVDRLTLYKSELTKEGAVYTPLMEFPLKSLIT